ATLAVTPGRSSEGNKGQRREVQQLLDVSVGAKSGILGLQQEGNCNSQAQSRSKPPKRKKGSVGKGGLLRQAWRVEHSKLFSLLAPHQIARHFGVALLLKELVVYV